MFLYGGIINFQAAAFFFKKLEACWRVLEYADCIPCSEVRQPLKIGLTCVLHLSAFDDAASVLEIWGVRSTPSLLLLLGPH